MTYSVLLFHADKLGFATSRERLENLDVRLDGRAAKRIHFADKEVVHASYDLRRDAERLQAQVGIVLRGFGECGRIFSRERTLFRETAHEHFFGLARFEICKERSHFFFRLFVSCFEIYFNMNIETLPFLWLLFAYL